MNYRILSLMILACIQSGLYSMDQGLRELARQNYLKKQAAEKAQQAERERNEAQEQQKKVVPLRQAWQDAVDQKDLATMYALAKEIVVQGGLREEEVQTLLQQKTEECALNRLGDQEPKQEENTLHAVTLNALQKAKNDQERANILLNAYERFVTSRQPASLIAKSVDDVLAPLVVNPDQEQLEKVAIALITAPVQQAIKGALDPEGNLLYFFYRYGIWRPGFSRNEIKVPTALQWLNELIDRTTQQGRPVTGIINLCHETLNEKPVAFNLAAACLYHRLVVPLKAKKRTNIIVQLSDAQLFAGTPYFQAVEEAAKPEKRVETQSPVIMSGPSVTTTTATHALETATRDDEQEDRGLELQDLFMQALATGNIDTAETLRDSLIAAGMPKDVIDDEIAQARLALGQETGQQNHEDEFEATEASKAELRELYARAVRENDLPALQNLFGEFMRVLNVPEDELNFQIARIQSLQDDNQPTTVTSTQPTTTTVVTTATAPAIVSVATQPESWFSRLRNTVSDPAALSALALGALVTTVYVIRR